MAAARQLWLELRPSVALERERGEWRPAMARRAASAPNRLGIVFPVRWAATAPACILAFVRRKRIGRMELVARMTPGRYVVVSYGREVGHLLDAIAGFPVAYFIQQMVDFKSGARKSADPHQHTNTVADMFS
jgi:hypothetical protein